MLDPSENENAVVKSFLNDYVDSFTFTDIAIEPDSIPETMKYRDFERAIAENGIDVKFTRAKFHFYQSKGLVSKGELIKENQARYTRDQFFEYAFAHMLVEHNSIESAVTIINKIRPHIEEGASDFIDLVGSLLEIVKLVEQSVSETIPKFIDSLLKADDSTLFSENERKGLITFMELSLALSYQKAAANLVKKFIENVGEKM